MKGFTSRRPDLDEGARILALGARRGARWWLRRVGPWMGARAWSATGDLIATTSAIVLARGDHAGVATPIGFLLLTGIVCLASLEWGPGIESRRACAWAAAMLAGIAFAAALGRAHAAMIANTLTFGGAFALFSTTLQRRDALIGSLREASCHDLLTGLPNRRLLQDRLDRALHQARQYRQLVGVLYLDLDGFKAINDTLGHASGDQVLREAAARLSGRMRAGDTVARVGGDEFICVLANLAQSCDAPLVARELVALLHEPFIVQGRPWRISVSIGISIYPADGLEGGDLLRRADAAMYRMKHHVKSARGYLHSIGDHHDAGDGTSLSRGSYGVSAER